MQRATNQTTTTVTCEGSADRRYNIHSRHQSEPPEKVTRHGTRAANHSRHTCVHSTKSTYTCPRVLKLRVPSKPVGTVGSGAVSKFSVPKSVRILHRGLKFVHPCSYFILCEISLFIFYPAFSVFRVASPDNHHDAARKYERCPLGRP